MEDSLLKKIHYNKIERLDKKGNLKIGFSQVDFAMFKAWFNLEVFNQGCHYCGTTNEKCLELFEKRIHATRGGKRGRRLELDRRNPVLHYDDLDNLVWCCYWCNNAKSNFFSDEEFKSIAKSIGEVLQTI